MLNQSVIDLNEMSFRANSIYCGDCNDTLSHFPEESVDLIYLDPPFFSNQVYQEIWKDGFEIRGFEDRWKGGLDEYLEWMKERLLKCHRVLKETGSIFLHCDYRANHSLKIFVMDKIFLPENFRNEIIWHYQGWRRKLKTSFNWHYDTILFYSKTQNNKFHSYSIPWESQKQMAKRRRQLIRAEENGREYIMDQRCGCENMSSQR